MVHGGQRRRRLGAAGRVHARGVAEVRRAPRLVQRGPGVHPVAERRRRCRRRSPANRSAVSRTGQPPASSSSCGRSQWYSVATGRTPSSSSRVDQPRVEVEAGLVERAAAAGLDPRPGDREPVGVESERLDVLEVLRPAVVVVVRDVAGVAVQRAAGGVAEGVPDGRPPAVLGRTRPRSGRTRSLNPRRSRAERYVPSVRSSGSERLHRHGTSAQERPAVRCHGSVRWCGCPHGVGRLAACSCRAGPLPRTALRCDLREGPETSGSDHVSPSTGAHR